MEDNKKVEKLLNELRKFTLKNSSTKDEIVSNEEDLSKSYLDEIFDIDIFFSRKPGMRRSVQLISSGNDDSTSNKISFMTALASLCDTAVSVEQLDISEEDIVRFMIGWLDMHKIKIKDFRKDS